MCFVELIRGSGHLEGAAALLEDPWNPHYTAEVCGKRCFLDESRAAVNVKERAVRKTDERKVCYFVSAAVVETQGPGCFGTVMDDSRLNLKKKEQAGTRDTEFAYQRSWCEDDLKVDWLFPRQTISHLSAPKAATGWKPCWRIEVVCRCNDVPAPMKAETVGTLEGL